MIDAGSVTAAVSLVVSLLAVSISAYSLLESRSRDRRDLFLSLHTRLNDEEMSRGLRVLFETAHKRRPSVSWLEAWTKLSEAERDQAHAALATMDVLGYYVAKNYVRAEDVYETWGEVAVRLHRAARPYLELRRAETPRLWPYLTKLADGAPDYPHNPHGVEERPA